MSTITGWWEVYSSGKSAVVRTPSAFTAAVAASDMVKWPPTNAVTVKAIRRPLPGARFICAAREGWQWERLP